MRNTEGLTVLALLLMSAAVGCGQGPDVGPYEGKISAFAIRARVVDEATGLPIAGATVCAKYEKADGTDYVRGETRTDADGRFTIPASPEKVTHLKDRDSARRAWVNVIHPEYAPTKMSVFGDREFTLTVTPMSSQHPRSGATSCRT